MIASVMMYWFVIGAIVVMSCGRSLTLTSIQTVLFVYFWPGLFIKIWLDKRNKN